MKPQTPVFTIGHGARSEAVFLELLQRYAIQTLVDVRSWPQSRFHPQYNRNALMQSLPQAGISYAWMGHLLGGRPKDPACYDASGKPDYGIMAGQAWFREGIAALLELNQRGRRLALMCSERDPRICHRSLLIAPELQRQGLEVQHIDAHGNLITHKALAAEPGGLFL